MSGSRGARARVKKTLFEFPEKFANKLAKKRKRKVALVARRGRANF